MNKLERETFFSYKHLKDEEMKAASAMFKPVLEAIESLEQAQKELAEALKRVQHQTNMTLPPNAQRAATRRKIEMLGAHTQSNTNNLYQVLVEAKDCAVRSVVLRRAEQKQDEEKANEDLDRESRQAQAELSKPPTPPTEEEAKQEELRQIRERLAPYVMTGAEVREAVERSRANEATQRSVAFIQKQRQASVFADMVLGKLIYRNAGKPAETYIESSRELVCLLLEPANEYKPLHEPIRQVLTRHAVIATDEELSHVVGTALRRMSIERTILHHNWVEQYNQAKVILEGESFQDEHHEDLAVFALTQRLARGKAMAPARTEALEEAKALKDTTSRFKPDNVLLLVSSMFSNAMMIGLGEREPDGPLNFISATRAKHKDVYDLYNGEVRDYAKHFMEFYIKQVTGDHPNTVQVLKGPAKSATERLTQVLLSNTFTLSQESIHQAITKVLQGLVVLSEGNQVAHSADKIAQAMQLVEETQPRNNVVLSIKALRLMTPEKKPKQSTGVETQVAMTRWQKMYTLADTLLRELCKANAKDHDIFDGPDRFNAAVTQLTSLLVQDTNPTTLTKEDLYKAIYDTLRTFERDDRTKPKTVNTAIKQTLMQDAFAEEAITSEPNLSQPIKSQD